MITKRIRVTKSDIKNGKRGNARSCPLAMALHRAKFPDVAVMSNRVKSVQGDVVFWLTEKATKFVCDFDGSEDVKPFSFTFKVSNRNAKKLGYKGNA